MRFTPMLIVSLASALLACETGQPNSDSRVADRDSPSASPESNSVPLPKDASEPIVLMWQVQQSGPQGDFQLLKDLGVNAVQASRLATWPAADVQAYLDAAARVGLKVFVYLGIFREGTGADCSYADEGLRFVEAHKGHPAIFAWHSLDEPAGHDITRECQRALYRAIKQRDPARPIMVSSNNDDADLYTKYFDEAAFDIFEMHKYVNPDPSASQEHLLSLFRANRSRGYPVIITLRAFNAPQKPLRRDMTSGSLKEQYEFFIAAPAITASVGFYGWDLSPNRGIRNDPAIRRDFMALMESRGPAKR